MIRYIFLTLIVFSGTLCFADDFQEQVRQVYGRTSTEIIKICAAHNLPSTSQKEFLTHITDIREALRGSGSYSLEMAALHFIEFCFLTSQNYTAFSLTDLNKLKTDKNNGKNFINHLAYTLLVHMWNHDFKNIEPEVNNLEQEAVLAPDFQEVIDFIELSNIDPSTQLLIDINSDSVNSAFQLFADLAESMQKFIKSADENHSVFAKLAMLYLMKSLSAGTYLKDSEIGYFAFYHLVRDITEAWKGKKATYRWFTYTIRRMLMIDMMQSQRLSTALNTKYFNIYYLSYFKTPHYVKDNYKNHASFCTFVDRHGSFNGWKRVTPQAHVRLFPHMIFLPFPFELTPLQMVKLICNQKWWALGYAFGLKSYDNSPPLPPLSYYMHDAEHWDIARTLATFTGVNKQVEPHTKELDQKTIDDIKAYVRKGLRIFHSWRYVFKAVIEAEEDPERQHFFAIFALDTLHERRCGLLNRLTTCLCFLEQDFTFHELAPPNNHREFLLKQFEENASLRQELPDKMKLMKQAERDAHITGYLHDFRHACLRIQAVKALATETKDYIIDGHEMVADHYPKVERIYYDPTAFMPTFPRDIISQPYTPSQNTWHYVYHFKFIHLNWDKHSDFDKTFFKAFTGCFPPFNVYPKFEKLTVDNQHDTDLPKDHYEVDRVHFGNLMPNGDEIDIFNPVWIEKFSFLP